MDLTTLDKPIADIAGLMTSDLAMLDRLIAAEAATLKRRRETFSAILARRFEEDARKQLVANKKDTGTVNLQLNGHKIKVEFKKEVEWDQAKLAAALNVMKPEEAKHYATVKLSVGERLYTAAPPAIQAALAPARTVKAAKPTFSFVVEDAEAA